MKNVKNIRRTESMGNMNLENIRKIGSMESLKNMKLEIGKI